jgi:hypothetical protein
MWRKRSLGKYSEAMMDFVAFYHLISTQPTECFNDPESKYELIPEDDELDYDLSEKSKSKHSHRKERKSEKKSKKHKKRKRESSRSARYIETIIGATINQIHFLCLSDYLFHFSPEVRHISDMADALSVMRKKARKDDKKVS